MPSVWSPRGCWGRVPRRRDRAHPQPCRGGTPRSRAGCCLWLMPRGRRNRPCSTTPGWEVRHRERGQGNDEATPVLEPEGEGGVILGARDVGQPADVGVDCSVPGAAAPSGAAGLGCTRLRKPPASLSGAMRARRRICRAASFSSLLGPSPASRRPPAAGRRWQGEPGATAPARDMRRHRR